MSQFLAEAQVLIRPNTLAFAAELKTQLTAAIASVETALPPVVVPATVTPAGAGVKAGTVAAQTELIGANAAVAASTSKVGTAAEGARQSLAKESAQASAAARHHEQLARGAGTAGLSFLGLRAQVLAASGAFVIGATAALILRKSIGEASALTEELNKTAVVFGSSAKQVQDFAKTTASSLGISEVEALRAAGIFGNLFRAIDIGQRPAAQMSQRMVRLAADLASFNNADPTRVLEALRSGLVGQARPLRVFGIFLTQARAQQEALIETGKKNIKALTNEEIVRARYTLILRDSALAQGDFARTSDRLANQARILRANLSDLGTEFGQILIPVTTSAVGALNDLLGAVKEGGAALDELGGQLRSLARIGPVKIVVDVVQRGLGAGDQGPGGPPSLEESLKKAVVPAALIAGSLAVAAAPETGGLSLLAAQAAFTAGGLIAAKQAADAYNAAVKQAALQSTEFAAALRGVGVDTKAAETPLLSTITDIQKLVQSLSVQAFPAEGLKSLLPHISAIISVLRTGPPLAQAFADKLQRIELKLQFAENLSPEELRKLLAEVQGELQNFLKGHPLNVTADVNVKTKVTLDTRTAAAEFAGPASQLAEAQRQRAEGLKSLRALLGLSPGASRAEIQLAIDSRKFSAGRKAAISRALAEVNAADAVISAAARDAAASAKKSADDAARAQAQQTQAFIDRFSAGIQNLQDKVSAAANKSIEAQIAANNALLAGYKRELAALKKRLRDMHLHGQALKILKDAIAAVNRLIKQTRIEITNETAQRRQEIIQARQTHLEAMLSIAETTPTTADDRKALEAIIRFDEEQIARLRKIRHRTREQNAQLDAYRVDLAQRNEALRNIVGQQKTAAALLKDEFTFLQTMTGFTANLLGNLIPGAAAAGLVGGTGAGLAFAPPTRPSNAPQLPGQRGPGVPGAGAIPNIGPPPRAVTTPAPPSSGQSERQIDWLHKIWEELHRLNRSSDHPEAKHQRRVGTAVADYGRSTPGM